MEECTNLKAAGPLEEDSNGYLKETALGRKMLEPTKDELWTEASRMWGELVMSKMWGKLAMGDGPWCPSLVDFLNGRSALVRASRRIGIASPDLYGVKDLEDAYKHWEDAYKRWESKAD